MAIIILQNLTCFLHISIKIPSWSVTLANKSCTNEVVHAVLADDVVHVLIPVDLVSNSPEQASAILTHLLDHQALLLHLLLKPTLFLDRIKIRISIAFKINSTSNASVPLTCTL